MPTPLRTRARPPSSSGAVRANAGCWSPGRRRTRASSGSSALHNLLASGTPATCSPPTWQGEEVLGVETVADIAEIPDGAADLVFVCTPASANPDLLRACAAKGVRAAFVTSAGYGEAGDEGRRAERELVALADELGILLAGPERPGRRVARRRRCAPRSSRPYPPAGRIGVASQSRQLRVELPELARRDRGRHHPGGLGRQRAAVTVADYLDFYAERPGDRRRAGVRRGHRRRPSARRPLRRCRGAQAARAGEGRRHRRRAKGRGEPHRRAGRDDRCSTAGAASGITRAATVEEAFEAAATFATQPLPTRAPRGRADHRRRMGHRERPTPSPAIATSS